jgi:hypothetical protein
LLVPARAGAAPAAPRPTPEPARIRQAPAPLPAALMTPAPSSPASVARVDCVTACGAPGAVRPGSLLRVRGKALIRVDEVVFLGADGEDDDVIAATVARRKSSVDVRVPLGAAPGPVALVDRDGAYTAPSPAPLALEPAPAVATPSIELAVRAPRALYDGVRPPALTYVVHAPAPVDVAIDLVRVSDGVVVVHWDVPQVAPETPQRLSWDGLANRRVQRTGRYEFRVSAAGLAAGAPAGFDFARDRFPILGAHSFANGFGGERGHQGQDIFAACGTPLVAAHGGLVKVAGFHGRAGNYVVIDNQGASTDYAYMHLRDAPLVTVGERVRAGQPIGVVGATGAASGCHLHFESWTAPGWYAGGRPVDPGPALRSWLGK